MEQTRRLCLGFQNWEANEIFIHVIEKQMYFYQQSQSFHGDPKIWNQSWEQKLLTFQCPNVHLGIRENSLDGGFWMLRRNQSILSAWPEVSPNCRFQLNNTHFIGSRGSPQKRSARLTNFRERPEKSDLSINQSSVGVGAAHRALARSEHFKWESLLASWFSRAK